MPAIRLKGARFLGAKVSYLGAQLRGVLEATIRHISGWETCDHGMRLAGGLAERSFQGSRTSGGPMGMFPMGILRGLWGEGG